MFKWIARKILSSEIRDYEYEIDKLNSELNTCEGDIATLSEKANKYGDLERQYKFLKEENETLRKENGVMREYYKLDEEPSDEIKTKIHIDMRIHNLEMMLLQACNRPPAYVPVPYYGGWRI